MSNVQSAACWARDTPLGWLLLVLHDGRCALGRRREGRTKDGRGEQRGKRRNGNQGEETKMEN
jgi:hypothetical protein